MQRSVHSSSNANSDAGAPNLFMATLQNNFIGRAVAQASRFRFAQQADGTAPSRFVNHDAVQIGDPVEQDDASLASLDSLIDHSCPLQEARTHDPNPPFSGL
jgi:hypothetical protein